MLPRRTGALLLVLAVAAVLASCAEENYPLDVWERQHASNDAGSSTPNSTCLPARAQALPARLVAMSASGGSSSVVLVSDLFQRFAQVCGSCHGPAVDPPGQGGFQITTATDFPTLMTASVIAHVLNATCPQAPNAANPSDPMPPCSSPNGQTYAQRSESDPVRQFADLVQAWIAAGRPSSFTPSGAKGPSPSDGGADGGAPASPYVMTPDLGDGLTNIGNCVPARELMGIEEAKALALDAKFAGLKARSSGTAVQMIGLPEHLAETDLFTFDSAVLAQYGVLAYAPGYPLWSDNAGKLRHVRVPRGQSIQFDKATQQFVIPPDTRFYKTFMKQIIDTDGSYRYRKIETRLIVARPDINNPDGSATQTALFGTYKWNDDESDAILVETPLNDGKPFADTLFLYNIDEPLAADILGANPPAPEQHLLTANAARHYAIPSSQRCIQCHMGSPSQSFVLGFTPLQINRRPTGIGGVIEATGADELTQLQRFIDAGIITGIDSTADVLPLEQSQGSRTPRNDYELVAQGYMLGNCAHCHNPRGFPTVQSPVLKDVLNFLPSATDGGIFQFPLERYSPRIGRGLSGSTPIPYVTPSLVDLPRDAPTEQAADIFVKGNGSSTPFWVIYAPWRSLIYRNVESTFAYTDDLALYPHMPFNTPGYDPRAKQILSDWMVSIPAIRKHPDIPEYAYRVDNQPANNLGGPVVDTESQPYSEVAPGDLGYDAAVAVAQQRLSILHSGKNPALPIDPGGEIYSRYSDLGETDDILDPDVLLDPICHPIPGPKGGTFPYPFAEHPHWVATDLTDPPGPWQPRQPNWPTVLVEQMIPPENSGCMAPASQDAAYADQVRAVHLVQDATLDQVRDFVTKPIPFGLWQEHTGCNFSSVPTVSSFTADQRPHWMDVTSPPGDAPVYMQTPGATVFKMICINCHGPKADSNGRLAQNLATMSGGLAQVADFRDGLFGPADSPDSDIQRVYGNANLPSDASSSWTGVTPDDRAARYMAWMGLGGTSVNIPVAILEIVAVTKVLDHQRFLEGSQLSANMLSQAKALCLGLVGPPFTGKQPTLVPGAGHGYFDGATTGLNNRLIFENGDAELWMRLCAIANPAPIHVVTPADMDRLALNVQPIENSSFDLAIDGASGQAQGTVVPASVYPQGAPIGNEMGTVAPTLVTCDTTTIDTCNKWPWCIDDSNAGPAQKAWFQSAQLPVCPAAVKSASHGCMMSPPVDPPGAACFGNEAANTWAVRGAINAGFSVFLYVKSIEGTGPAPDYNQCELLK